MPSSLKLYPRRPSSGYIGRKAGKTSVEFDVRADVEQKCLGYLKV